MSLSNYFVGIPKDQQFAPQWEHVWYYSDADWQRIVDGLSPADRKWFDSTRQKIRDDIDYMALGAWAYKWVNRLTGYGLGPGQPPAQTPDGKPLPPQPDNGTAQWAGLLLHSVSPFGGDTDADTLEQLCSKLSWARWKANEKGFEAAQRYNDLNISRFVGGWMAAHPHWENRKSGKAPSVHDCIRAVDSGGNTPEWNRIAGW